jgi:hypothetical protein
MYEGGGRRHLHALFVPNIGAMYVVTCHIVQGVEIGD